MKYLFTASETSLFVAPDGNESSRESCASFSREQNIDFGLKDTAEFFLDVLISLGFPDVEAIVIERGDSPNVSTNDFLIPCITKKRE